LMTETDAADLPQIAANGEVNMEADSGEVEEETGACDDPFAMMGGMGTEEFAKVTLMTETDAADLPQMAANGEVNMGEDAVEQDAAQDDGAEAYPKISYGAAMPERLATEKMEKKMKKVNKEGGKRGVEIEGAADMGGLQFFCTTMDEPAGCVDLLYESMRSMNEQSDPAEEERKGGSGRIGKMLISKDQADSKLALVAYVPPSKQSELTASEWMEQLLKTLGGGEIVFKDATTAKAVILNDSEKGMFVMKLKDSAITESINHLKSKGLFPDRIDDSDDEFIFGDDDFPSADNEADNGEVEEEAGDCDDPFAMMGGMGAEEFAKVTLMTETDASDLPQMAANGEVGAV